MRGIFWYFTRGELAAHCAAVRPDAVGMSGIAAKYSRLSHHHSPALCGVFFGTSPGEDLPRIARRFVPTQSA
ncbi:MAG TPA: hypothetical protein H9670_03255 [Firmicutes bacterium]|nr:hypothetical protein [Bacillota bacterium]